MNQLFFKLKYFAKGIPPKNEVCRIVSRNYGIYSPSLISACVAELEKAIMFRDIQPVSACQKFVLDLLLEQIEE